MPSLKKTEPAEALRNAAAALRTLVTAGDALAALALFSMMIVNFVDVVGRSVLNRPLPGATELTEILVAATVCCALPSLTLQGRHVTIDVLDYLLPDIARAALSAAASLIGFAFFSVVAWRMWIEGGKTARFGGMTPLLEIPMAPVLYGIAILTGLTAITFLFTLLLPAGDVGDD